MLDHIKGEIVAYSNNNCVGKIILCSTKQSTQMLERLINDKIYSKENIQLLVDMISNQ